MVDVGGPRTRPRATGWGGGGYYVTPTTHPHHASAEVANGPRTTDHVNPFYERATERQKQKRLGGQHSAAPTDGGCDLPEAMRRFDVDGADNREPPPAPV